MQKKGGKWRVVCEWVETVFYAYGWVMTIVIRRWVQTRWIVTCYLTPTFSPIMYLLKAILFWKKLFDIKGKWIGISANFIHLCLKLLLWMCQGNSEFGFENSCKAHKGQQKYYATLNFIVWSLHHYINNIQNQSISISNNYTI